MNDTEPTVRYECEDCRKSIVAEPMPRRDLPQLGCEAGETNWHSWRAYHQ